MTKVIVTGQQIGLLGGPLYTTYKVLGAAALAKQNGGRAIFWLETNDADFAEINHVTILDRQHQLVTYRWEKDTGGRSTGKIPVDANLVDMLNRIFDELPRTDFTESLRDLALTCYRTGISLGDASMELAQRLYGRFGVEPFDPSTDAFLGPVRPILEKSCMGTAPGEQCPAFARVHDVRHALFREANGFRLRNGDRVDLGDITLLPNRDTRPICQDAFFSTDTYVAGPAEVDYLSGLGELYARHGIKRATVQRRMSVTLLESRTVRLLERCCLDMDDILNTDADHLHGQVLKQCGGTDMSAVQDAARQALDGFFEKLQKHELLDPAFRKTVDRELKALLGRKRSEMKNRMDQQLTDVEELSRRLKPLGEPQERVFPAMMMMNRYGGLAFLDWLMDHHQFNSQVLEIDHA